MINRVVSAIIWLAVVVHPKKRKRFIEAHIRRGLWRYVPQRCYDCGVLEGEFHKRGCQCEVCPVCGRQLISCECVFKKYYPTYVPESRFKRPGERGYVEFNGLPEEVYRNGPPKTIISKWQRELECIGLIPWIRYPNLCARCGQRWPEMFSVPDRDWERYVEPSVQGSMLCKECYLRIKGWVDRRSGSPQMLVDPQQYAIGEMFKEYISNLVRR